LARAHTRRRFAASSGHEAQRQAGWRSLCAPQGAGDCRDLALLVARYHGDVHRGHELTAATIVRLLENTDALRRPDRFEQLLEACACDFHGRLGWQERPYPAPALFRQALARCAASNAAALRVPVPTAHRLLHACTQHASRQSSALCRYGSAQRIHTKEKMNFAEIGLHPAILKALTDSGYSEPTAVQQQAIPAALAGRDLMVSSQTGSGKTAAFMLPALHLFASQQRPATARTNAPERRPGPARGHDRHRFQPAQPRMLVLTPTRELALQVTAATEKYGRQLHQVRAVAILGGMPYPKQMELLGRNPEILVATPGR
jgi:hypothetical protein